MAARRIERVNRLLRDEMTGLVMGELKDPRLAAVSILEVRTSADLRHATVYVRAGGDEDALAEGLRGLESAEGFIRRELGRRLRLRRIPELRFEPDRTLEQARRIETLLDQVRAEDAGGDGPSGEHGPSGEEGR